MEETVTPQMEDPRGLPRLGEPAPAFECETTMGPIRLEDFQGNWLILFSHPADFTPVCTTEFVAFATVGRRIPGNERGVDGAEHRQRFLAHRLGQEHRG